MKRTAYLSLIIGTTLLLFYIIKLWQDGYINPKSNFSLETAKEIAPFAGSFVGMFFSLAGTFLVIENLRIQGETNAKNQLLTQKNQFESIFFNMISLHNQIAKEINTDVYVSYKKKEGQDNISDVEEAMKGKQFFDCIAPSITFDFKETDKTKQSLLKIYSKYYAIHSSDMGHYFRNLYHIVKYIDKSPYLSSVVGNPDFLQKEDYAGIIRAQLSNNEIICLALNGLTSRGKNFKPLIDKYELLRNIYFDYDLPKYEFNCCIPGAEDDYTILVTEYPHLKAVLENQKENDVNFDGNAFK